jgi:hypothetical protein
MDISAPYDANFSGADRQENNASLTGPELLRML